MTMWEKLKLLAARQLFGHPLGVTTAREIARENPSLWREALPADNRVRRPPTYFGSIQPDLIASLEQIPSLGTLTVPGGLIAGALGLVFSREHKLIADLSWHGASASLSTMPNRFNRTRHLSGTCLSLGSDFAAKNYAHFLLDCLPRAALFLKSGYSFSEVDHIHLPGPGSKTAWQTLERLGIPLGKCRWALAGEYITADRLLATSFPGIRRNYPRWTADYLRSVCVGSPRRIHSLYIPRNQVRKIANQAELLQIAERFGIRNHDSSKLAANVDDIEIFHSSRMVIGAHGAGLANLAFCQPGTRVLEMFPSDHVHPYYYTLSESADLDYACLVGQSLGSRPKGARGPSPHDFVVDPAEFTRALESMTAS